MGRRDPEVVKRELEAAVAAARAQIESGPKAPAVFPHEQEGYGPPEPDPEAMREIQRRVDAIPPIDDDKAWGSESWVSSALEVAEPVLIHMPGVKELPVEWLWERRIPRAAVVILDGHPGTGKSTIALDLAARVSKGQRMPDGAFPPRGGYPPPIDQLEPLLKPLVPRLFEIATPEEFRKALATILAEIARL